MITVATSDQALSAIGQARSVLLSAYVLRPGALLDAVETAARRGARVTVRLEGQPYGGDDPSAHAQLAAQNRSAVAAIRAAGGDAALVHTSDSGGPPLHMKALVCDRTAYLDDRNWPGDGEDTIVRDDFRRDVAAIDAAIRREPAPRTTWFWTQKAAALGGETRLLYGAQQATRVDVESESFGYDGAYGALKTLAANGVKCRLLVSQRDVTPQAQAALETLKAEGVQVRVGDFDEKMAVVDDARAWVGSANATIGYPDQIDWGMRTDATGVVHTLQSHFNSHWSASTPLSS